MSFPGGFLWGTATSAHQVEGGNVYNDSWLVEHLPSSPYAEVSGDACDHYHRYAGDIALVAGLGLGAYRCSLEWSRIEPEEGEFSTAALEHYRRVLDSCHEHGLTPMLTFHHFTSPRWIATGGGWESARTADRFARFCERSMRHLGDLVPYACTLNEPNLGRLLHGVLRIPEPPPATQDRIILFQNARSPASRRGHARGAPRGGRGDQGRACGDERRVDGRDDRVGGRAGRRGDHGPVARHHRGRVSRGSRGRLHRRSDLHGHARRAGRAIDPGADAERTQMGYLFQPEALGHTIRRAAETTGLPIFVTENGLGSDDDARRCEFISRALRSVEECIADGLDVRGYFYWSLFDNFEWALGYRPTFGLVAVDRATQERTPKPSARHLGAIARANGLG